MAAGRKQGGKRQNAEKPKRRNGGHGGTEENVETQKTETPKRQKVEIKRAGLGGQSPVAGALGSDWPLPARRDGSEVSRLGFIVELRS
jgi:hypothetical protein